MTSMRLFFVSLLTVWLAATGSVRAQGKIELSFGTGFVVSSTGHVVTAHHNIKDRDQVLVGPLGPAGSADANRYQIAEVVRVDAQKDLALLKTKLAAPPLKIAPWADVTIGLEAITIGFPQPRFQGITRKITEGIVNGDRTESGDAGYFQFSAETQKGNSGGPVLGPDGSVIGVVRAKLNALSIAERTKDLPQNVNYGIKSSTLLAFLRDSGLSVPAHTLNPRTHLRPYEIYRLTSASVVLVIARNKSGATPSGIKITPRP